jgi:hypothetical protein
MLKQPGGQANVLTSSLALIVCSPTLRPMKLVALFQALLLLSTTVLPEGRYLLAPGAVCEDGCKCTTESREAGMCCCSQNKSAATKSDKTANSCCAAGGDSQVESCCSKNDTTKTCCQTKSRSTRKQNSPVWGIVGQCPCGSDSAEVHVLCMPRTRVQHASLQSPLQRHCVIDVDDESCSPQLPAPATPPPQNHSC